MPVSLIAAMALLGGQEAAVYAWPSQAEFINRRWGAGNDLAPCSVEPERTGCVVDGGLPIFPEQAGPIDQRVVDERVKGGRAGSTVLAFAESHARELNEMSGLMPVARKDKGAGRVRFKSLAQEPDKRRGRVGAFINVHGDVQSNIKSRRGAHVLEGELEGEIHTGMLGLDELEYLLGHPWSAFGNQLEARQADSVLSSLGGVFRVSNGLASGVERLSEQMHTDSRQYDRENGGASHGPLSPQIPGIASFLAGVGLALIALPLGRRLGGRGRLNAVVGAFSGGAALVLLGAYLIAL